MEENKNAILMKRNMQGKHNVCLISTYEGWVSQWREVYDTTTTDKEVWRAFDVLFDKFWK